MQQLLLKSAPLTDPKSFRLGSLLRFTESLYDSPVGVVGLVYESFMEKGQIYCGILLENGTDVGLLTDADLRYLAEKLLQIPTAYRFINPERLMQDYKQGTFKKAFSLAYPQETTVPV